jgi:hypothetical protein
MLALVMVVLAGCRTDATIDVRMAADGSGVMVVRVVADAAAIEEVGGEAQVITDDLESGGWDILRTVPDDGGLVVEASRDFANPTEANALFTQIAGGDITRELRFGRAQEPGLDQYILSGEVDLSGGAEAFSDDALAEVLGSPLGQPLGSDAELEVTVVASVAGSDPQQFSAAVGAQEPLRFEVTRNIERPEPALARADASDARSRGGLAAIAAGVLVALALVSAVVLRRRPGKIE